MIRNKYMVVAGEGFTGVEAAYVYRKGEKDYVIPMPIFGHWMKNA